MWASIPRLQNSVYASSAAARLGWSLSVMLHLAAYGALLSLGSFAPGSKPAASVTTRMNGSSDDPATGDAREHVRELLLAHQELRKIQTAARTEYQRWHEKRRQTAVPDVLKAVQAARKAQMQAVQAQSSAETAQQAIVQARQELAQAQTPQQQSQLLSRMEQAAATITSFQAQVQEAQDRDAQSYAEGLKSIEFVEGGSPDSALAVRQGFEAGARGQSLARDAQNSAGQAQAALAQQIRSLKESLTTNATVQRQVKAAEQKAGNAQQAEERANTIWQQIQHEADAAHAQSNYATAHAQITHAAGDQAAAQQAQQRSDKLAAAAARAQAQTQMAKDQLQAAQGDVLRLQQAMRQQEAEWKQKLAAAEMMSQQAASAQQGALQAQQHAQLQQTQLEQAARDLRNPDAPAPHTAENTERGTREGGAAGAEGGPPGPEGGPVDLARQDLAQLYDTAVSTERLNLEAFQQIQAHAMAMAQGISLEHAQRETDATPPVRPALGNRGRPFFALTSDSAAMNPEQREAARQQIAAMSALAQQMVNRAKPRSAEAPGARVASSALQAAVAPSPSRIALATEEEGRPAKDLTVVGGGMETGETNVKGQDENSRKWSKIPLGDRPHAIQPPASPPIAIKAVPGRVVGNSTLGAGWMFVDSWYTIGPFPNPGRENINKPFPPESGVDLDALYVGKDNRMVRWKWLQSADPMVVPNNPEEYAIYYGYTELWFDAPADLWIAVGSDDKSTLWIEDQLVWVSSDILKGWRIDEGLRRVHFKKGLNRLLFRLENGWRGLGISVCLCLQEAKGQ